MSDDLVKKVAREIASADGWATTGSTIADYMPLARAVLAAIEKNVPITVVGDADVVDWLQDMAEDPAQRDNKFVLESAIDELRRLRIIAARPPITGETR